MQDTQVKLKLVEATGTGKSVPIVKSVFSIGRRAENDLQVNDAYVSRHHAEIIREGERFKLVDRESKHGTYVNGERIQVHQLKHQDKIQFGNNDLPCLIFLTQDEPEQPQHLSTETSIVLTSLVSSSGNDLQNVSRLSKLPACLAQECRWEKYWIWYWISRLKLRGPLGVLLF